MWRFRLERVLAYRRLQVDTLEQELRQRSQQLQHEETALTELQTACRQQQADLVACEGQQLAGATLRMWREHYRTLETQRELQHATVLETAQALAVKQQEVVAARQKKKMLEKMADTARQRYSLKVARYEQQRLDDSATTRSPHGY
jgi:flagellar export protein FliJ